MTSPDWERWAARALKGERLHEPPPAALQDALDLGGRLRPARRHGARWGLSAAAVLVVAIGGALLLRGPEPPLPSRSAETTIRGSRIELVAPDGELDAVPSSLRWSAKEGAASYRVRVTTIDDIVLWEGLAEQDSVTVPPELSARILVAVTYLWRVEALDDEGVPIARSESGRFLVAP